MLLPLMTQAHVVVTGGNTGIGFAAAKLFLSKGYQVTIVGRSKERLEVAQKELGEVEVGICDISSLESIEAFVNSTKNIDILVNNAGVWLTKCQKSELGQELTFATNHLGTMFLTVKLMENNKLNEKASIVILSSELHKKGVDDINYFDNLNASNFSGWNAYSQTKLYNLLFAYYLVKKYIPERYSAKQYKVASVHPGFIPTTEIARSENIFFRFLLKYILPWMPMTTTVEDAAGRIFKAATDADSNGKYIGNKGYEEPVSLASDESFSIGLWNKSSVILKLK